MFLFLFIHLFVVPRGLWDLSSPTRDRIWAPEMKVLDLKTGLPANSLNYVLF